MEGRAHPSDVFELVGKTLARKYRVERVVAEGGFGIVYAGRHLELDLPIAIKVLRPQLDDGVTAWSDHVELFVEEAKAIARLHHPAVVDVLDVGVTALDGVRHVPWMVLEWLEGETLEAHLASRRDLSPRAPREAFALLRPVLEAIAAAHAIGITHRDLKPNNVMLVPQHEPGVRVVDFGIAKTRDVREDDREPSGDTTTSSGFRAFSSNSAAPEQIAGTRTGPWTDVYSLALMLTEVLTHVRPYPEGDANERLAAVFDATRPTPKKVGIDVGAWEPVLARALAVKPSARQPNAGVLLAELEAALRPPAAAPSPRSNARFVGAGVAAVLLLGALIARSRGERSAAPRPADASAPTTSSSQACTSNRACVELAGGAAAVCKRSQGRCVPLASVDCHVLADERALVDDDTVWLGALLPQTGPTGDEFGLREARAADLARRDFDAAMLARALEKTGDSARPLGLVSCDDAADSKRAAAHLVDDVGVPAVLGFKSGIELTELATTSFLPKHVLSMVTMSTNPLVTHVPQPLGAPRLIFRTTYRADGTAQALAAFVTASIEKALGRAARVALIREKNGLGASIADDIVRLLRLEGANVADGKMAGRYRELTLEGTSPDPPRYAEIVSELLTFQPDVILLMAEGAAVEGLVPPLEAQWSKLSPPRLAATKPRYASIATIGQTFLQVIGRDESLRRRVFGVAPASGTAVNARFVAHFHETFPSDVVTETNAPNSTYDAYYALAYATYAVAPETPITGDVLSRSLARLLPPGRSIEVGQAGIVEAYDELVAGGNVDVVGATGSMDFDLQTGETAMDQAILCVAADGSGLATDGVESGLVYSATEHRLLGQLHCP